MTTCNSYVCLREEQCDDCFFIDHCKECAWCEHYDHEGEEVKVKKMWPVVAEIKKWELSLAKDKLTIWNGRPPYRYFDINSIITSPKFF